MAVNFYPLQKTLAKLLNSKYRQKLLDTTKNSATNLFKTASKRAILKTAETAGSLVGNKITEKIVKAVPISTRKDPRKSTALQIDETSVQPTGIPRERHISPERRKQIIDKFRLLQSL